MNEENECAVILCRVVDGAYVPVPGVAPFPSGAVDKLKSWLKKNAPAEGDFAFVKVLCEAKVSKLHVEQFVLALK